MIDTASQATDLATYQAWLVLNPHRLILLGDHNQLAPPIKAPEAEWAWKQSSLEKLMKISGSATVRLKRQYRTIANIYHGTNYFNDNEVLSDEVTSNRDLFKAIMEALPKITLTDADGTRFTLRHPVHFFDLQNAACTKVGSTQSSANKAEADFAMLLAVALARAGVPLDEMMTLCGYNGQYDELMAREKRLMQRGVRVRKIDSSQGGEAGVVLFSFVRDTVTRIGFMGNRQRLNVGTNRAREAFFWIGCPSVITQQNGTGPWGEIYRRLGSKYPGMTIRCKVPVKFHVQGTEINFDTRPLSTRQQHNDKAIADFETAIANITEIKKAEAVLALKRYRQLVIGGTDEALLAADKTWRDEATLRPTLTQPEKAIVRELGARRMGKWYDVVRVGYLRATLGGFQGDKAKARDRVRTAFMAKQGSIDETPLQNDRNILGDADFMRVKEYVWRQAGTWTE